MYFKNWEHMLPCADYPCPAKYINQLRKSPSQRGSGLERRAAQVEHETEGETLCVLLHARSN